MELDEYVQLPRIRFEITGHIEINSDRNPLEYHKIFERWLNDHLRSLFDPEDEADIRLKIM